MKKTGVALVDDHQLFRDGLREIIDAFDDFQVVLDANSGKDFITKLDRKHLPQIVLLDINMKEMDGFQTAEWIKSNHPDIRVLALSMYENENAVIRMLRSGAGGYILKDIRKQELYEALCSIAQKGYYYSDVVTGNLIHAINNFDRKRDNNQETPSLTQKEIQFLKLACSELTYKEIAGKMSMSVHTVDGYREHLFEKLGIKSRVGLVLYAVKNKIYLVE